MKRACYNFSHQRMAERKEFVLWTNLVNESAGEEARIYHETVKNNKYRTHETSMLKFFSLKRMINSEQHVTFKKQ
ncbi:MAG: hypothetical protein COC16_05580 [Lutibacter sp.]|nr:MAG: hypothetical protein COC16_05580 [Lutibacter sp.]